MVTAGIAAPKSDRRLRVRTRAESRAPLRRPVALDPASTASVKATNIAMAAIVMTARARRRVLTDNKRHRRGQPHRDE